MQQTKNRSCGGQRPGSMTLTTNIMLRSERSCCRQGCTRLLQPVRSAARLVNVRNLFLSCFILFLVLLVTFIYFPKTTPVRDVKPMLPIEDYFLSPLTPRDKTILIQTTKVFIKAVEANNLTYFVFGGTLLGPLRHHDRIPWNDDVDIIMKESDKPRIGDVLSKLESDYGIHVMNNALWKFYPSVGRYIVRQKYRSPYIDLFFYRENKTHIWNTMPYFTRTETWLKRHVFPLRYRPFGELSVAAPCNGLAVMGSRFNIAVCTSRHMNHLADLPLRKKTLPCSRLAHLYPFVRTRQMNGSLFVEETLMFDNVALRNVTTRAPC